MKRSGIIVTLILISLIVAVIVAVPVVTTMVRVNHDAALHVTGCSLTLAKFHLDSDGMFTNSSPSVCHLFEFTNHYSISGTDYVCAVAADSWDYRNRSNLLAITTNGMYLYFDSQGVTNLGRDWHNVPGY